MVALALRVLAILLVTVLSGAPKAIASVFGCGEPACATPCDGDEADGDHGDDDDQADVCSPLCSTGPCAKVFSGVASVMFVELEMAIVSGREVVPFSRVSDVPDGVAQGVFHPPRA